MKRSLQRAQAMRTLKLGEQDELQASDYAGDMIGTSDAMRALIARVKRVAASPMNTLILGETGSGKERCATTIHKLSTYKDRPLVTVNCAALPSSILMSELFGCDAGAFTNARKRRGLILSADQGTLFLDEIGELSGEAQAALLRALDQGEVRPLGSDKIHRVSLRLICATHRDLPKLIQRGEFRADLYHRISTVTLVIPALRQRVSELPLITSQLEPTVALRLNESAWRRLSEHVWPGNIRELKNVLTRIKHEHPLGVISASHLNFHLDPQISSLPEIRSPLEVHRGLSDECEFEGRDKLLKPRADKYLVSGPPAAATLPPSPEPPPSTPPRDPTPTPPAGSIALDPEPLTHLNLGDQALRRSLDISSVEDIELLLTLLPDLSLEELKMIYIDYTVRRFAGNISKASRILEISRGQIYRSLEIEPMRRVA